MAPQVDVSVSPYHDQPLSVPQLCPEACGWTSGSSLTQVGRVSGSQHSRAPPTLPRPMVEPELCLSPADPRDFSGS